MKTKLQTINSKLILLEIIIVITGLFIAIFTFTSIEKIKHNFELLNNINSLKINITNQNQQIYDLIETDQFNISLYKKEKTNSLIAFNNFQKLDSAIIENLLADVNINRNPNMREKAIKINEYLKDYKKNFDLFVINLRDRGFQTYGKMGEVFSLNNQIIEKLNTINDFALNEKVNQLADKVNNYGKTFNKDLINQISELSNEIVSQMYQLSEEYNYLDLNLITSQFDLMQNKLQIVEEKNSDIGVNSNTGITKKLKYISSEIIANLLDISNILNKDIVEGNDIISKQTLTILLVITFIIALYLIIIIRAFVSPIVLLKTYLEKLTKGALPNAITFKNEDEFSKIGESLNTVVKGLKEKTEFATHLGKGDLKTSYTSISDRDTLGNALLTLQKSLQKAAEEDKKHKIDNERRRWANEGLAKFSEILRMNNDNTEMLCDSVIKNLVKYLEASLGGIYLYNDDNKSNPHLFLASTFAYDRKKFQSDKINLGEGLVGACALEKQTIYMTEIPDDYIKITSGLGLANPKILLIVPLNLENTILGVLEIASFNPFEEHVLDFVEKLAESIASTLASAKINERTQQLLEQSQKQAVEMAEQEEEMRQNMEELQATQEESSRKENEMFGILHAINSTSYYFETDMDGTISEMNDRMLFILEMQKEHIIGMHHSELTAMNKNSPEYITFWNELKNGNAITKIQKYESINKNEIWLKQNYTPIFNKEGSAVKVVCFSTDISEMVQLEKDLQKLERELSSQTNEFRFLNAAIDVSYVSCNLNTEGLITNVNSNFEKLTGYARKELLEKNIKNILSKDQAQAFERIWENLISGHPFNNVIKFLSSTKEVRLVKSTFKPIMSEKNELVKIIFIGEPFSSNDEND